MTIGKRQSSVRSSIRTPKFLDKANGFYGRLDEGEAPVEVPVESPAGEQNIKVDLSNSVVEDTEVFHEDDGEMLLRRKPSRRSSRWRSLRRKESKEEKSQDLIIQVQLQTQEKDFPIAQEPDDQVLIRDRAERGPEEEQGTEEEERGRREQEEGIKALKRTSSKHYRKALDRALRRGWESFITNLYSVTLTSVSPPSDPSPSDSSPSSPSAKRRQHSRVLAELH